MPLPSPTATLFPTPTATSIPPDLPEVPAPILSQIAFQDESSGWGIGFEHQGAVLRSIDGGATWLDASPPGIGGLGNSAILTSLDVDHAWMLLPGTDFFSGTLYRTTDGGVTWNSNPAPFGFAFLQFLDDSNGYALAGQGFAAGSEAVEMFQTSDGGATWTSLFHNDPNQPGSSDSLPLDGIKNGMTFLDVKTGWITGTRPLAGDIYLYVTRDGGLSWSQQSLPLPAGYAADQFMPQAPVFFGEAGFLPLLTYLPDSPQLSLFTTQDAGLTWSGDPSNPDASIDPGLLAFADAFACLGVGRRPADLFHR